MASSATGNGGASASQAPGAPARDHSGAKPEGGEPPRQPRSRQSAVLSAVKPLLTAFFPSQIFQAITDGPILLILLVIVWLKPRRPGVVGACWLIGYGVLRIITEQFREPDAGVALTFGLLTRGQTLSTLMIIGGAALGWIIHRRQQPRIGGLFAP